MAKAVDPATQAFVSGLNSKFVDSGPFSTNKFEATAGVRFDRIFAGQEHGKMERVYAFVERATGQVYKPASLKKPAPGPRFKTVGDAIEAADLFGSFLYKR